MKNINTLIFIFLIVFFKYNVSGQNVSDDLFLKYEKAKKESEKINSFYKNDAWKYSDTAFLKILENDINATVFYLNKSDKLNSTDSILYYRNIGFRGIVLYRKDQYKNSLRLLNSSINFISSKKETFIANYSLALFYQYKGRVLSEMGLSVSAVNAYLKSNSFYKKTDCDLKIFENYKYIGRAYQKIDNVDKGNNEFVLENFKIALKGFKKLKKIQEVAWMYLILSDFYIGSNNPYMAKNYLDSCNTLARILDDKELIPITENNYGEIYLLRKKFSVSEKYFKKAIEKYKKNKNKKNLQNTYSNLSELYKRKNKARLSLLYIDSAINIAEKNNYKLNLLKFYLVKKDLIQDTNIEVFELFNKYVKISNELKKEQQSNLIFAYQEYFKTKKLKSTNENLILKNRKQSDRIILLLFIFLFVIIIITGLIIMVYLFRKKRNAMINEKLQELQMQSVQAQLYPHLLFNATSAAGSVIFKEKREIAYDYLVKMSQLMRKAMEDTKRLNKTLGEEIDFVKNYLEIQRIRFPERFRYEINVGDNVDMNIQVPQMIIQTYVENAVKYGLEPLKEGGILKVDIFKAGNIINIIVEDNGTGIEAAQKLSYKGTGSGIKIMNKIYAINNKKKGNHISFRLDDLKKMGRKGTRSIVQIKFIDNDKRKN